MSKTSSGILLYRMSVKGPEFFLVHPGGPFWARKDEGAWTIPKGELNEDEDPLSAAIREFREETGYDISGESIKLTAVRQAGGKQVLCYALRSDIDISSIRSNTFEMEWPPRSGRLTSFPEIDRGQWFDAETARIVINKAQVAFIDELTGIIKQ